MSLSPNIKALGIWLQKEVDKHEFADVSTIIRIHDGRITLIEKTVVEKVKPAETSEVSHENK